MKLVICERSTGTWNYHLRRIASDDDLKPGGGILPTLCGEDMSGWDTTLPLESWGHRDHIPSTWCEKCKEAADEQGLFPPSRA